jgi:hypothetical protein
LDLHLDARRGLSGLSPFSALAMNFTNLSYASYVRGRELSPGREVGDLYYVFEILPDGTKLWKAGASEEGEALKKMEALAKVCPNELRIVDVRRRRILASKPSRDCTAS